MMIIVSLASGEKNNANFAVEFSSIFTPQGFQGLLNVKCDVF